MRVDETLSGDSAIHRISAPRAFKALEIAWPSELGRPQTASVTRSTIHGHRDHV